MLELPIKFRIKNPSGTEPSSLHLLIFHRDFGREGRLFYSVGEKILPYLFDNNSGRVVSDPLVLKVLDKEQRRHLRLLENKLDSIKMAARETLAFFSMQQQRLHTETFKKMLDQKIGKSNYRNNKSSKQFAGGADKISNKKSDKYDDRNANLYIVEYIQRYETELEAGKRLTESGKILTTGSIKNYKTCRAQLMDYEKKHRCQLRFEDINQEFYTQFITFLNNKSYAPNSIGKHLARIKRILRSAKEDGLYLGNEHEQKYFKVLEEDTEEVYLTQEELSRIEKLDLSQKLDLMRHRDVFLIGCYIAQRVSDYKAIRPEHIQQTSKGVPILKLIQQKTGETVLIPIGKQLKVLLAKYKNQPPMIKDTKLNESIKEIAKLASIDTPIELERIRGGKKIREVFPKYELIKSHTARRTGATLMYLAGIPSLDIMKITGHKKESNFMKYICVTKEENANNLSLHPYFQ